MTDSLRAELVALFHGLVVAWNSGGREVIVYSDSVMALYLVDQEMPLYHLHGSVVQSIRDLLPRSWRVQLRHTKREGNFCADVLAKKGAGQCEAFRELAVPPAVLWADAMRVTYERGDEVGVQL